MFTHSLTVDDEESGPADLSLLNRGDDDDYAEDEHCAPTPLQTLQLTLIQLIRTHTLLIASRARIPSETQAPDTVASPRKSPGYEVGESSAAGTARQVGPTTARADLYGFADTLEAAPGRRMSRELGYGIRDIYMGMNLTQEDRQILSVIWMKARLDPLSYSSRRVGNKTEDFQSCLKRQTYQRTETVSGGTKDINRASRTRMNNLQIQQGPAKGTSRDQINQRRP
ncbi:hypothetical protein Tco_1561639 [Tanacetum coccineum]